MSTARGDFKHKEEEQLSRQQVAERLIDIAYALTAGGPLELGAAGRRVTVPVANELRLERELKAKGNRLEFGLELSWSTEDG
jgi:amphi-Trp domain-containing protein